MAYRTDSAKRVRGGKRCVAAGPNLVSCGNNQRTEGISMYLFPNAETDAQRRKKWENFVRKHRPGFSATTASCLCSAHFDDSCFDVNRTLAKELNMRQKLKKDAVPSIDVAGVVTPSEEHPTDRRRRQVSVVVCVLHARTHKAIVNFNMLRSGCKSKDVFIFLF